jgi:uncharacterized protein YceK
MGNVVCAMMIVALLVAGSCAAYRSHSDSQAVKASVAQWSDQYEKAGGKAVVVKLDVPKDSICQDAMLIMLRKGFSIHVNQSQVDSVAGIVQACDQEKNLTATFDRSDASL